MRGQADPSRELPPRSELFGRRGLHLQQNRADRTDAGRYFDEPLAAFIALMPSLEFGFNLVDLPPQLRVLLGLDREEPARCERQAFVGLDALEQRIKVSHSLGGGKAKLSRIAPNSVR